MELLHRSLKHAPLFALLAGGFLLIAFALAWGNPPAADSSSPELSLSPFDTSLVSAPSFEVFDVASGTVFAARNADQVRKIASVTKLITASAFIDHADMHASTTITKGDIATEGEAGGLHAGEVYQNRDLLYPLLLSSSNDAAAAMLRVDPMLLGDMEMLAVSADGDHTRFSDSSGLSNENVSTAASLAKIGSMLFRTHQYIFDITRLTEFMSAKKGWANNNPVVRESGYRGGKHGYTPEAEHTIIAFFDEPLKDGKTRTIGYVLLGSTNLKGDIDALRREVQKNVRF